MIDNFAKPASGLSVPALGNLDVTASPTGGQGLALSPDGSIPLPVRKLLPGYELTYAQITSPVSIVSVTEATPTAIVTLPSVNFQSMPTVMVNFYSPYFRVNTAGSSTLSLYQSIDAGATYAEIGRLALTVSSFAGSCFASYRFRPLQTGPVLYRVGGWNDVGTADLGAGNAGGAGAYLPAFARLVMV